VVLVLRVPKVEDLRELCSKLGGNYVGDRKACVLPNTQVRYTRSRDTAYIEFTRGLSSVALELNKRTIISTTGDTWILLSSLGEESKDIVSMYKAGVVTVLDKGDYYVVAQHS